jgi:hypothetical protein
MLDTFKIRRLTTENHIFVKKYINKSKCAVLQNGGWDHKQLREESVMHLQIRWLCLDEGQQLAVYSSLIAKSRQRNKPFAISYLSKKSMMSEWSGSSKSLFTVYSHNSKSFWAQQVKDVVCVLGMGRV